MATSHIRLWTGENTHRIALTLTNPQGQGVTGAAVTARILERDGETPVAGPSWPITLIDAGGGSYTASIPASMELEHGKLYTVEVIAVSGAEKARWHETGVKAEHRGL